MDVLGNGFWRVRERLRGPWPEGPCLWLHGASLGECRMLLGLLRCLTESGMCTGPVVLTTQKSEIITFLSSRAPSGCVVVMAPLDLPWVRRAFWSRVRPWALVLGENELWPGWLREALFCNTPVALVSGRFHRFFPGVDLGSIRFASMQTEGDLTRLRSSRSWYGRNASLVGGDWKNLSAALGPIRAGVLPRDIGLLLVSVHREEWKALLPMIVDAVAASKRVVLAPRLLEELAFFRARLAEAGLVAKTWPESSPGCVALVDVFGLVGDLALVSQVAFVGGSFCRVGIHDFWEPLRAGCEVWVGENLSPHEDLLESMLCAGIIGQVRRGDAAPRSFVADPVRVDAFLSRHYKVLKDSYERFCSWLDAVRIARFGA